MPIISCIPFSDLSITVQTERIERLTSLTKTLLRHPPTPDRDWDEVSIDARE